MLTITDLLALPEGYVSDSFQAVVRKTFPPTSNKSPMKGELAEQTGSAVIKASFWSRPNLRVGDLYVFSGKSIKITTYQGVNEVSVGDKAQIDLIGGSAHAPEQAERAANLEPSVSGQPQSVNGQTVGMALKEALALVGMANGGISDMAFIEGPTFWKQVHACASHIIRVSRALETGKLAGQPAPQPAPAAPPPVSRPQPGPDRSVKLDDGDSDPIPF